MDGQVDAGDAEALSKVQAQIRGRNARKGDAVLLKAIAQNNYPQLEKLMAKGSQPNPECLVAALQSPIRAFASLLVANQNSWGVDPKELAIWNDIIAALNPKPSEEDEEPEPADVESEEWQQQLAEKHFGEGTKDGVYVVRRIAKVGIYVGERAEVNKQLDEPGFDAQVSSREGYGVLLSPQGDVYAGQWLAGKRQGLGAYCYKNKSTYVGYWKGGLKHGNGRMVYADGGVYEGDWRYNKRHGQGVYTYANGDLHVGAWFTGKKHGRGKYTSTQLGSRFVGMWRDGELEKASVKSSDGATFLSGFASKQKPEGDGAFIFPSGAMVKGSHKAKFEFLNEQGEDEEEDAKAPGQWTGSEISDADRTSIFKMAAAYGGGSGILDQHKKAILIAPDYATRGTFPAMDNGPICSNLKELCIEMGLVEEDILILSGDEATKEAVVGAIETLAMSLGPADVAFIAYVGHSKYLLDLDAAEAAGEYDPATTELEEGLCMSDEALSNDDLAELIKKFSEVSAHLFLWLDTCFSGACIKTPMPNFCAISSGLAEPSKPEEGSSRTSAFFTDNMTQWLDTSIRTRPGGVFTYQALYDGVIAAQGYATKREANFQMPTMYCLDPDLESYKALA